jgi:hypothetical protein
MKSDVEASNNLMLCRIKFRKMKKLNKIQINPEKVMRNEELYLLRGGYDVDDNCQIRNCTGSSCSDTKGSCTKCSFDSNLNYYICVTP